MATAFSKIEHHHFPRSLKRIAYMILGVILVGTLGYMWQDNITLTGAVTKTLLTLAHVGKGGGGSDVVVSGGLDIIVQFLGVIMVWFAIWAAFDLALAGKFDDFIQERKMKKAITNLNNHYIVCGAGRVGFHVGRRLKQRGERVLFIEKDVDILDKLDATGYLTMDTGPIDERILLNAGIRNAKGIAVALGDDAKNLVILMTAKELNPRIKAAVRVSNLKLLPRFRKAGADMIVIPEAVGGIKLADALLGERDPDVIV